MIIYVANFINKSSNNSSSVFSSKNFIRWLIMKGDDIMLPILAIEIGTVVAGKILAYGDFKWINN